MGLIYIITNQINYKGYIGQTKKTLEERIQEHIYDCKTDERCKKRPLYKDINKYGINNFAWVILEPDISNELLNEREQYWIEKYKTIVPNGYNISIGGSGNSLIPKDKIKEIINLYQNSVLYIKEIAKIYNVKPNTISDILKKNNIKMRTNYETAHLKTNLNKYKMINIKTYKELVFNNYEEMIIYVKNNIIKSDITIQTIDKNIKRVINGKRKSYHNYIFIKI